MPVIRNVTSGPVGKGVDRGPVRGGVTGEALAEVAQQLQCGRLESGGLHELEAQRAPDLEMQPFGEHEARRRLVGPVGISRASRHHRPPLDGRAELFVVGDDREQIHRPDSAAGAGAPGEEQAHAGTGVALALAGARRCRRDRPHPRTGPAGGRTGCFLLRARRPRSSRPTNSGYAFVVRAAPAKRPSTTPPPRPATRATPSQAAHRLRSSARRRASTAATRAPFPARFGAAKLTAHHPAVGRGTICDCSCVATLTAHVPSRGGRSQQ